MLFVFKSPGFDPKQNNYRKNTKSKLSCILCDMYVSIEHQGKLDLQRQCLWKSHMTILNAKRLQESDPYLITKGSDVKKQASTAEVNVNDLLAEHNLPLAKGPLSKSIFPEPNIAKEHSYS